jgi:CBS domain-containing protein
MDGDRLVGVISIGDLVNAIIESQAQTIDDLHTYITGGYPA